MPAMTRDPVGSPMPRAKVLLVPVLSAKVLLVSVLLVSVLLVSVLLVPVLSERVRSEQLQPAARVRSGDGGSRRAQQPLGPPRISAPLPVPPRPLAPKLRPQPLGRVAQLGAGDGAGRAGPSGGGQTWDRRSSSSTHNEIP